MSDEQTQLDSEHELNEQELDQVAGGALDQAALNQINVAFDPKMFTSIPIDPCVQPGDYTPCVQPRINKLGLP